MTPEELTERCTQAYDQLMTFDLPVTHEASESLYLRNMAILKSLCWEMIAVGVQKVATHLRTQHIQEFGCARLLGVEGKLYDWCQQEAQRVTE